MKDSYGNDVTSADVDRLLSDASFSAILRKVKDDQINLFLNSARSDIDKREEAYSIIKAVEKIEQALIGIKSDEAIKEKRKKLK